VHSLIADDLTQTSSSSSKYTTNPFGSITLAVMTQGHCPKVPEIQKKTRFYTYTLWNKSV